MRVRLTLETKDFDRHMTELAQMSAEPIFTKLLLSAGGEVIQAEARRNIRKKLNKNPTGKLESEIELKFVRKRIVEIGVQRGILPYARIHEYGGTIVPRKADALFIPLRDGVKPNQEGLVWGRDFVLAQRVTIPQRAYMRPAVDSKRREVYATMGRVAHRAIRARMRKI